MTVPMFITLLTAFSAISSLCTEAFKKMFDSAGIKYASNILVFIIACVVGIGGTAIYYVLRFEYFLLPVTQMNMFLHLIACPLQCGS